MTFSSRNTRKFNYFNTKLSISLLTLHLTRNENVSCSTYNSCSSMVAEILPESTRVNRSPPPAPSPSDGTFGQVKVKLGPILLNYPPPPLPGPRIHPCEASPESTLNLSAFSSIEKTRLFSTATQEDSENIFTNFWLTHRGTLVFSGIFSNPDNSH